MRVKKLTDDQILARRVEVKTKVTLLKRPTTNNLTDYFTDSQYLDNSTDKPSGTRQGKIQPNVQLHRHRLAQRHKLRTAQQHQIARKHQLVLYTKPDNKNKLENLRLGIAILFLVISAGAYGLLSNIPSPQSTKSSLLYPDSDFAENSSRKDQLIASRSVTPTKDYLQSMAMSIMQDTDWDIQKVHYFKRSWDNLELELQTETKNSIWYQLFENALVRELNSYVEHADSFGYKTAVRERALLALADSLTIRDKLPSTADAIKHNVALLKQTATVNNTKPDADPIVHIAAADDSDLNVKSKSELNSELNSDIARNNKVQAPKVIQPIHKAVSAQNQNKVTTLKVMTARNSVSTRAQKPVKTASLGTFKAIAPAPIVSPPPSISKPKRGLSRKPTKKELDTIKTQFVNSYEQGDIKQFASLFADDVISNSYNDIDGLKNQYSELFRSTAKRHMILHNIKWKFRKDKAIGKAKMELRLVSTQGTREKTQFGRLQLVAEKQQDKIVISRIYVLTE